MTDEDGEQDGDGEFFYADGVIEGSAVAVRLFTRPDERVEPESIEDEESVEVE